MIQKWIALNGTIIKKEKLTSYESTLKFHFIWLGRQMEQNMFPKGFTNRFTCDPPWKFLFFGIRNWDYSYENSWASCWTGSYTVHAGHWMRTGSRSFIYTWVQVIFLSHTPQCQVAGLQDYPNDASSNMNIGVWEMHCNMEFTSNYFLSLHQPSFQQCTWSKAMVVGENIMGLVAVILVCVNAWQGLL